MKKYNQNFKLLVVNHYNQTDNGYVKTGQVFNINESLVRKWVLIYKYQGKIGLKSRRKQPKYSIKFKYKLIKKVLAGNPILRVALQNGLSSDSLLSLWVSNYKKYGMDGLTPRPKGRRKRMTKTTRKNDIDKTTQELLDELEYLRAENAYLKKLEALAQKRKQEKKQK